MIPQFSGLEKNCYGRFKSATFCYYLIYKITCYNFHFKIFSSNYLDKREECFLSSFKKKISLMIQYTFVNSYLFSIANNPSWPTLIITETNFNCSLRACKCITDIFQSSFETSCLSCHLCCSKCFITILDLSWGLFRISRHECSSVSTLLVSLVIRSMGFGFPLTHIYLIA